MVSVKAAVSTKRTKVNQAVIVEPSTPYFAVWEQHMAEFKVKNKPVVFAVKRVDVPNAYARFNVIPINIHTPTTQIVRKRYVPGSKLSSLKVDKHLKYFPKAPGSVLYFNKSGELLYIGCAHTTVHQYLYYQISQANQVFDNCPTIQDIWDNQNLGYIGWYALSLDDNNEYVGYQTGQFINSLEPKFNAPKKYSLHLNGKPV
jgi:hypothetical protein